jgi:hypothetical protein
LEGKNIPVLCEPLQSMQVSGNQDKIMENYCDTKSEELQGEHLFLLGFEMLMLQHSYILLYNTYIWIFIFKTNL